jgi:hypothetical protein
MDCLMPGALQDSQVECRKEGAPEDRLDRQGPDEPFDLQAGSLGKGSSDAWRAAGLEATL